MSLILDAFDISRDRAEAPLLGDTDALDPWLWLVLVLLLAFAWVRILHYMGRVPSVE